MTERNRTAVPEFVRRSFQQQVTRLRACNHMRAEFVSVYGRDRGTDEFRYSRELNGQGNAADTILAARDLARQLIRRGQEHGVKPADFLWACLRDLVA